MFAFFVIENYAIPPLFRKMPVAKVFSQISWQKYPYAFWHKMMAYLSKEIHLGPLLHIKHKCFTTVTEAINKALEMSSQKENSILEEGGSVSYTMYVKVKYTW